MGMNGGWIIDVDVQSYFDSIPHGKLVEVLKERVNDGGIIRQIGKWLNAGVMEEGTLSHSDEGAPRGGVISPVLSNVYLHVVYRIAFRSQAPGSSTLSDACGVAKLCAQGDTR
jgi:RNA-directed DNA polymerase